MNIILLHNICKDICQEIDTIFFTIQNCSIKIKSLCVSEKDQLEDLEKFIDLLKKDLKEWIGIELSDLDIWFTICSDDTFYEEVDLKKFVGGVTWLK